MTAPGSPAAVSASDVPVRVTRTGEIAIIEVDNPPVNAISHAVRAGLLEAVRRIEEDSGVAAAVIACAGRTFIAGADIREMAQTPREPHLPDVLDAIEDCTKPVVAAIHGTALGGGLEVALACHARVFDDAASAGLPEVKLGLVPGAGGTQRLPRLVGIDKALELVTSGRTVKAHDALALGIADRIAAADLRRAALELARSLVGRPLRRTGDLPVAAFDRPAADAKVAEIRKRARGAEAPGRAADLVLLAAELPLSEGLARERETFLELRASDQSAALRHAFFAEREVWRVPGLEDVAPRPVRSVGIVGAGTMGSGIAVAFADAGFPVKVIEAGEQALAAGRARVAEIYERLVASGRLGASAAAERQNAIVFHRELAALADRDLVIEAVYEDLEVKRSCSAISTPSWRRERCSRRTRAISTSGSSPPQRAGRPTWSGCISSVPPT